MSDINFRDATTADIPVILDLCRAGAAIPNRYPPLDLSDPEYAEVFDAMNGDPNHRLIVGELDGEAVATLQICYLPGLVEKGWRGQLENVHVRGDMRGKGLGAKMVAWAVTQCRQRGCLMVQLTSNKVRKDAHRFYEHLGFDKSHEGFKLKL